MSQIMLQLPDTLYSQLEILAQHEGVQLTQYILYILTRQAVSAYAVQFSSKEELQQQTAEFNVLLQRLGNASSVEIENVLAKRETVEPELRLSPDIVERIQKPIAQKSSTN